LLVTHVGRAETRTLTLDYGYTPEALLNNFELLGAWPKDVELRRLNYRQFSRRRLFRELSDVITRLPTSIVTNGVVLIACGEATTRKNRGLCPMPNAAMYRSATI
jgi:hypothetical protein